METNVINPISKWEPYNGQALSAVRHHHIFLITVKHFIPRLVDQDLVLSAPELDKSVRFHRMEDRHNFLVRKYALRVLLSQFLGIPAGQIAYTSTANKKPAIAGLHFNTSHSKNAVAIAVSATPIGVDIEYCNKDFDYADLLDHCFSKEERLFIASSSDPRHTFYVLWTRKEALLKATGEGLAEDLINISSLLTNCRREGNNFRLQSHSGTGWCISTAASPEEKDFKLWHY